MTAINAQPLLLPPTLVLNPQIVALITAMALQDTNELTKTVIYRLEQLIGIIGRDAPNSAQADIPMWDIPDEIDTGTDIVTSPAVLK